MKMLLKEGFIPAILMFGLWIIFGIFTSAIVTLFSIDAQDFFNYVLAFLLSINFMMLADKIVKFINKSNDENQTN